MEVWRKIPGYPGYEVSDQGRVKSLPRVGGNNRLYGGTILKCRDGTGHNPYLSVYVGKKKNGRPQNARVHHLVLLAFSGPRPNGMICCHNNGNKLDNRLENLRYDTPRANVLDRALHGTDNAGERHGMHKISDADVRLILNSHIDFVRDLAKQFNVSEACIRSIINMNRRHKGGQPFQSSEHMVANNVVT